MKDKFEEEIRRKWSHVRPDDLGWQPDKEALWRGIQGKSARRIGFSRPFFSHAAAVCIGVLVGVLFFVFPLSPPEEESLEILVQTTPPVMEISLPKKEPRMVIRKDTNTRSVSVVHADPPPKNSRATPVVERARHNDFEGAGLEERTSVPAVPESEPPVSKIKVVYWADVRAVYGQPNAPERGRDLIRQIRKHTQWVATNEQCSFDLLIRWFP